MKILHIGDTAFVGYHLCQELHKRGHEITLLAKKNPIFCPSPKEDWVCLSENPLDSLRLCKIDLNGYDLVHIHYLINWTSLGAALRKIKKPVILHCHGSDTRPLTIFHQFIQRFVANKSRLLLYSTPDLEKNISWFKGTKTFLPNPTVMNSTPTDIKKHKNRVLIYATLNKIKQTEKIFPLIKDFDYLFDLIDIGPHKDDYKKIAPKNVRFIPPIKKENITEKLSKYPLILGGSQDGVARVCELETMSLGIPTLFPFAYNHCYPESLPMLELNANSIDSVFNDPSLGLKQCEWVRKFHSVEVVVDKLMGIYQHLLTK